MKASSLQCEEARDALLSPSLSSLEDPLAGERTRQHRQRCDACRAFVLSMEAIFAAVELAAGPPLDELTRARIGARVEAGVQARARRRPRRTAVWIGGFAIAAAAVFALVLRARALPYAERAQLRPYLIAGTATQPGGVSDALGRSLSHLEVPAGGMVRAELGPHARIALWGPARVQIEQVSGSSVAPRIALSVEEGLLLGELDHAEGELQIRSHDAVTTVVGTVFAVDVRDSVSRISVSRGAVEVRADAVAVRVESGWTYRVGAPGREPLSAELAPLLAQHATATRPPVTPKGIVAVVGTPERADVSLGKSWLGPTPLVAEVPLGAIHATLAAPNHQSLLYAATVPPSQPLVLRYALQPNAALANVIAPTTPAAPALPFAPPTPLPVAPRSSVPIRDREHDPTATAPAAQEPPANDPATASPVAGKPAKAEETADDVYALAEAAMRTGDDAAARARLDEVVRRFPRDSLANAALYEMARLAIRDHDLRTARARLDQLLGRGGDTFAEPARYLRCRIDVDSGQSPAAVACLRRFRQDFVSSPHDAEALAVLAGLLQAQSGCVAALPLLDEYLKRYATGAFAVEAATRRRTCAP